MLLSDCAIDTRETAKHAPKYIEEGTFFNVFDSIKVSADILKHTKLGVRHVDLLLNSGRTQYNGNDLFRCFHKARIHVENYEEMKEILTLFEEKLDFRSMKEVIKQFEKIMVENQKLTKKYTELDKQASEYTKNYEILQKKYTKQQELYNQQNSQTSEKNAEIQKLQAQIKSLQSSINSKDSEISNMKAKLSAKDTEIQSLKSQLSSSNNLVNSLKQEISRKESTISQLREKEDESESLNSLQKCSKADGFDNVHRIYTILSFAAQEGYMDTIKYAARFGYINVKCDHKIGSYNLIGMNGLIYAAYKGDLPLVKAMNKYDVDMKSRTKEGESIIHAFSISGNLEGLKYAENFLNINDVNDADETALYCSVVFFKLPIIEYLVNNSNVKKSVPAQTGTPLWRAIIGSQQYKNLANYMVDHDCTLTEAEKQKLRDSNESSSSSSSSSSSDDDDDKLSVLGKLLILNALLS